MMMLKKIILTFRSKCTTLFWCMYSTPSQICLMNSMLSLSVKVKSSATTLSKSSPPEILRVNKINISNLSNILDEMTKAYYSVTITISRGLSKAAASRRSFGCRSMFMILISSRTCSRSFVLIVLTNFAAKFVSDDFSIILLTVPYRPLPNSSNTSYRSLNKCPSSISTIRASNGGSNSSKGNILINGCCILRK